MKAQRKEIARQALAKSQMRFARKAKSKRGNKALQKHSSVSKF